MSTPDEQITEFDAAFKEAASRRRAEQAPAPAQGPAQEVAAPAQEAAPTEAVEPEVKSTEPEAKPAAPPADMQRQLADALQRERSSAGRISAFARQNEELRRQMSEMQAKLEKLSAPAPKVEPPAKDMLNEAPDLEAAVLRRVENIVAPLKAELDDARQRAVAAEMKASQVIEVVEPMRRTDLQRQHEQTWSELDKQLGTRWRDDLPAVGEWAKADPDTARMYEAAKTPVQCLRLLRNYYAENGIPLPTPESAAAPASQAPAKPAPNPNTERLQRAAGIPTRSAATPSMSDSDAFSSTFRQIVAQRRAAQAARPN